MTFTTAVFVAFAVVVVAAHAATRRRRRAWIGTQVAASALFLAWADLRLVVVYAAAAVWVRWWSPRLASGSRWSLRMFCGGLVAGLAVSRHTLFTLDLVAALGGPDWRPGSWWVPAGVSFLAFQAIMVGVDRARGRLERDVTFAEALLLLGAFPKALAGPLMRPAAFLAQMGVWPRPVFPASRVCGLVLAGLVKKVLVAPVLFEFETATARPELQSGGVALLRMLVGPMRVFCDVSAYIDLALAVGLLVGLQLPANFDRPFRAASLTEYWSRWHMTVTRFFGEYVFEPLRGSRRAGRRRVAAAVIVTMLLSGLWHGAGVTYLVWGGLHGVALAAEAIGRLRAADRRMVRRRAGERVPVRPPSPARRALGVVRTYAFVAVTGVLFTNVSMSQAFSRVAAVTNPWDGFSPVTVSLLAAVTVGVATHLVPAGMASRTAGAFDRAPVVAQAALMAAAVTVIFGLAGDGIAPFMYFRF